MRLRAAVIVGLLAATASPAVVEAFQLREYSLEEKVAQSEVVVIARAIVDAHFAPDRPDGDRFVTFETMTLLKGKIPQRFEMRVESMEAESDPTCCVISKAYLLFLHPAKGGGYDSVNGNFGVYKAD